MLQVILKCWEAGDLDAGRLPITYPDGLHEYVQQEYARLKGVQAKLIGMPHRPRSRL
jgi:hypothetical protein